MRWTSAQSSSLRRLSWPAVDPGKGHLGNVGFIVTVTPSFRIKRMQRYTKDSMRKTFDHDGFVISPPLVEPDLIGRARQHIRMLMSGVYETGVDPGYPRAPAQIVKDEPRALYRLYQGART